MDSTEVFHTDLCQKNPPCNQCVDVSILYFWSDVTNCDETLVDKKLSNLTDTDLINDLNTAIETYPPQVDVSLVLGGKKNDSDGKILNGTALAAIFVHKYSGIMENHMEWEQEFLNFVNNLDVRILQFLNLMYSKVA